jgi:hypothetical protein
MVVPLILISGLVAGCAWGKQTSGSLTPAAKPDYVALREYLAEAQSIIKEHDSTMNAVHQAIEAIKALSQPREMKSINQMTTEEIAAALFAKDRFKAELRKMEGALQEMGSEIVDFGILTPPVEAETYQRLMTSSFLKDQIAVKDWLYYYGLVQERNYEDKDVLQRADQNYEDAKQFRVQAEEELKRLLQMSVQ